MDAEPSHGAHHVIAPDKKYGADKILNAPRAESQRRPTLPRFISTRIATPTPMKEHVLHENETCGTEPGNESRRLNAPEKKYEAIHN